MVDLGKGDALAPRPYPIRSLYSVGDFHKTQNNNIFTH